MEEASGAKYEKVEISDFKKFLRLHVIVPDFHRASHEILLSSHHGAPGWLSLQSSWSRRVLVDRIGGFLSRSALQSLGIP